MCTDGPPPNSSSKQLSVYRKSISNQYPVPCLPPSLQVGARLISHAGSLTNLAKYPASTVQILGAEKALFRYWGAPSLLGQLVAAVMAGLGWSQIG